MSYDHNPLGVILLKTDNFERDLARLVKLRPSLMVFTQHTSAHIKPCLDAIPELQMAVFRTVLDNDGEKKLHEDGDATIANMLNAFEDFLIYQNLDRNRVYLKVGNEPDLSIDRKAQLDWVVTFMREARRRNIHLSVFGLAMANLTWDDWFSGDFDELLREGVDRFHAIEIHEYFGPVIWAGCAGRAPDVYLNADEAQEKYAPSPYDVQVGSVLGNWHVGRVYFPIHRCAVLGIDYPLFIGGEDGTDRMGDLENVKLSDGRWVNIFNIVEQDNTRDVEVDGEAKRLIVPWPHVCMRGWRTLKWYWEKMFPGMTTAQVFMRMLRWKFFVYDNYGYIKPFAGKRPFVWASAVYALCTGDVEWDQWYGFNVGGDSQDSQEWWELATAFGDEIYATPEPEPEPEPVKPGFWGVFLALVGIIISFVLVLLHIGHKNEVALTTQDDLIDQEDFRMNDSRITLWQALALVALVIIGAGAICLFAIVWPQMAGNTNASALEVTPTLPEWLQQVFAVPVLAIISYSAGIIWFLVELWKRYLVGLLPVFLRFSPEAVAIFLIFLFMGAHALAVEYQYDNALRQVADLITQLINVLGPYVLGVGTLAAGVPLVYDKLREQEVSGFSYNQPIGFRYRGGQR